MQVTRVFPEPTLSNVSQIFSRLSRFGEPGRGEFISLGCQAQSS